MATPLPSGNGPAGRNSNNFPTNLVYRITPTLVDLGKTVDFHDAIPSGGPKPSSAFIAALILLSPIVVALAVIATEVLIDGLMEAGVTGVSAIAIGAIGWVQFRRIWRSEVARQSGSTEVCEAPPIAAPPG